MQPIMRRVLLALFLTLLTVTVAVAAALPPLNRADGQALLRQGGVALLLRHGQTMPGVGDPPGFKLGDCATQRNLSPDGREAIRAMAARNRQSGIRFSRIYTSEWCRTRDTARLLAESVAMVRDWSALNSQFSGNPTMADPDDRVRTLLGSVRMRESWLLVTHQVNIASLTGISPASGEGVLVRASPSGLVVLGRVTL